jgi:hypothetical protein
MAFEKRNVLFVTTRLQSDFMKSLWLCRDKRDLCVAFPCKFTTAERRVLSVEAFIHERHVPLIAATTKYSGVVRVC